MSRVTSGPATLRSPLSQHVGKSKGKAQDLCINQADPASLSSTRQKEGKRGQPEVKHSRRTDNVAIEQDEIYIEGALLYFPCPLVLIVGVRKVSCMRHKIENMLSYQDILFKRDS